MNHRILFSLFFLLGSFAQGLLADTSWTAGSGTFDSLLVGGSWSNGAPSNTNPGTITGTAENPIVLSLTTTPDYNNRIFTFSQTQVTINSTSEKKFALAAGGTSTLTMSDASTLNAAGIWATWGGGANANFILNDTSAITVTGYFNVQESGKTPLSTANITLNGSSRITVGDLKVRGIMNLSGAGTGTFTSGSIQVAAAAELNVNGASLVGTTLTNDGTVNLNGGTLRINSYANTSAGTITLAGGTLEAGAAGLNVTSPIEVKGGTTSLISMPGNRNVYLSNRLTGSGSLDRSGAGNTLYLSGENSGFSGTLNVRGTNTYFTKANAGSASATWDLASGATLAAQNVTSEGTTATIELGEVTGNGGTIRSDSLGTLTLKVGGKGTDAAFGGVIQNYHSASDKAFIAVEKVGSGSWTLSGASTYSGGTTLTEGKIIVANNSALGTGKIILNGGTLSQNAVRTLTNPIEAKAGTASTIDLGSSNMIFNGNLSGSGTINRTGGTSTLYLGGDNSAFSGTMNLTKINTYFASNASGNAAGSANATWSIASGATLSAQGTSTINLGAVTGAGTLRNDVAGTALFRIGGKNTNETFTGIIRDDSYGTSETIVTSIEKVGTGSWTLTGASEFSGGTTLTQGTLILGGGTSVLGTGKLILNGGTLSQNAVRTLTNPIEAKAGTASTINIGSNNMRLAGPLSGSGTINREGGVSTLELTGDNSAFSGTLNLNAMNTYLLASTSGSANALWNVNATLSANSLGANGSVELGGVSGSASGTLRNDSAGTVTFRVGGKNTNEVFSGSIRNNYDGTSATIVTAIEKVGTGSWTLNGNLIHTGGTTVSGGRLNVEGALAGNLLVQNSAIFSPGQDGADGRNQIGTTTLSGAASIDGGVLLLEVDGTNIDQFNVNSLLFTNGGKLKIQAIDGYLPVMGDSFSFLTSTAPLPAIDWNAVLDPVTAGDWSIYAVGNDLVATMRLPEPTSGLLLLLALGLGGVLLRKKRG